MRQIARAKAGKGTVLTLALTAAMAPAAPLVAQTAGPLPPEAARQALFGRALAEIGSSGLRALLAASGNLGDLQNRSGSYRMAAQLERARTASLSGRIDGLARALEQPGLAEPERAALRSLLSEAEAELADAPRYDAAYRTATVQTEALVPLTTLGDRPVFLMVRGRVHGRGGGEDGLTVFSEGLSVGPVLVGSNRWIVSPGLTLGRTDVDLGPFDGASATTSAGPQLNAGVILDGAWSAATQVAHVWSWGTSRIMQPGPDGETEVRSRGWSTSTSAKAELRGRFSLGEPGGGPLSVAPRVGAFLVSRHAPPRTNSLGETGTGPFGERETVAAVRAGASLAAELGAWSPALYLGWEHELGGEMAVLVNDPQAFLAQAGVTWSWARGRRLLVDYGLVRGLRGLRRVSELTVVLILDG